MVKEAVQPPESNVGEFDSSDVDQEMDGIFLGMDKLDMLLGDDVEIGDGPRLVFIWGQKRHQVPVTRPITVGRGAACDIQIPASVISRRHFHLTPTESGLILQDLGALNRCTVNGKRVEGSSTLACGDLVETGGICFLYLE